MPPRNGPQELTPGTALVLGAWKAAGGRGMEALQTAVTRCQGAYIPDKYHRLLSQAKTVLLAPADRQALTELEDVLKNAVSGSTYQREQPEPWWFG